MDSIIDFNTKHSILFILVLVVFLIVASNSMYGKAYSIPGIKINSHYQGQEVPVGELSVSGESTDNGTAPCQVYLDWNDLKPFQNATAIGPDGENDYSKWSFVYTRGYHMIEEGNNELTAKVSCGDNPGSTKYYSLNVTGVAEVEGDPLANASNRYIDARRVPADEKNDSLAIETRNSSIVLASKRFQSNIESAISAAEAEIDYANHTKPYLLIAPSFSENNTSGFRNTTSLEDGKKQLKPIPPIADAGKDLIVNEGSPIALNASGSIDPDGIILSYSWKQNPHPLVTLGGAETKIWTFTAPSISSDTTFTFELTVTDNNGLTSADSINVQVEDLPMTNTSLSPSNNPPIAKAEADFEVNENTSLSLSGIASTDPDLGDSLNYSWKQIGGFPLWETLSRPDAAVLTLTSPSVSVDSMFSFELTVSDKQDLIDTDIVNVLVKDIASSPLPNDNITISSKRQDQKSPINIQIEVSKDPISLGHEQTVTVTAFDTATGEPIEYADIDGIVTYPSGETKEFDDDDDGIISFTLEIDSDSEPGVFSINSTASAVGYEEISKSRTFEAIQEEDEDKQNNDDDEEEEEE